MVALAAVVNKVVPDDKSISLFYNTGKAQVALSVRSGTDDPDPDGEIWAADTNDYNGYILNPSSMGAAIHRGREFVVAVTMPRIDPGAPQPFNQISLVSPIFQKLETTDLENNNLAMCSSGVEAWVYFVRGKGGNPRIVCEYGLSDGKTQSFIGTHNGFANTSLTAWFDPVDGTRHVIYETAALYEYVVGDANPVIVGTSGSMKRNTSFAASYNNKKVYLYYSDGNNVVRRSVKDGGTWVGPQDVNGPPLAEGTQLAVVPANGINHLFYMAKEQATRADGSADFFTHIRDPL